MIGLRPNGFWARLFFGCLAIIETFAMQKNTSEYAFRDRGTDLCQFVRVVFLWTPMILALNLITVGAVGAVVLVVPVLLFGAGYFWFWVWVLSASAVVAATVWLCKHPVRVQVHPDPTLKEAAALAKAFLLSKKRHFCPLIRFTEEQQ